jgi:hypothetical protein
VEEDRSVRRHRSTGLALLSLSVLALAAAAQPELALPARADKPGDKKDTAPAAPAALDFPDLPPDAIVVVCDSTAEALRFVPNVYVLTADRYRRMNEELIRLRKQLDRPAAHTPTRLVLKGKVDGNLVTVQAQFEFETSKPGDVVRLGCGLAQATGVSLDGKTPRLLAGRPGGRDADEGFSVQVDKPGEHQLTLDLVLAVSARPAGAGFVLDLPRAPITRIELDLPGGSRDVRLGGKPLGGSLVSLKGNQLAGNLGAVERLELDWKSAQAASAGAVRIAEGLVQVRLDGKELTTAATLTLRVLAGQANDWRLAVPRGARVLPTAADEPRVARIDRVDQKQVAIHTVRLKEPSAEPLTITVSTRTPAPRPGSKPVGVGPFVVLDAVRQSGSVLVSSSVADYYVEPAPHGDLTRRAASEEELVRDPALVAAFRYGPGEGKLDQRLLDLPWLDLAVESVRGQLRARLEHVLKLAPDEEKGGDDGLRWHVQTRITVTPRLAGIERFRVRMPDGCEFRQSSPEHLPERVREPTYDKATRLVEFRLIRGEGRALAPITVTVEGIYTAVAGTAPGRASLGLPQPQGMVEKDGAVRVVVPGNLELVAPEPERARGLELVRQATHELEWRCPRQAPHQVEVEWRSHRPVVQVTSLVDLVLDHGQGRARHELHYQLPAGGTAPRRLALRVPAGIVPGSLAVSKGGRLDGRALDGLVHVTANEPGRPVIELAYRFDLPRAGTTLAVPLVVPEGATQGETKVRVWSEPGVLPLPPREGWAEQNIEEVSGQDRLPVLVLRALRVDAPLVLRLGEGEPGFRVLIERALVRVDVEADRTQTYRVSYRLSRLAGGHLDFELPAPVATINLVATLDDKHRVNPELLASTSESRDARPVPRGTLVRLRLPGALARRPAVLRLVYHLSPDRLGATGLTTPLVPPVPLGEAGPIPARWQITAPAGWVVVAPEAAPGSPITWGLRGLLLAPRSGLTAADLEAWFAGGEREASERRGSSPPAADGVAATPTLVLWRDGTGTVTLTHVHQKVWLVVCSLSLVVLGLALVRLALSAGRRWVWACVLAALAVLGGLALVVFAPGLAGLVAYGCQPGLLVLVVLVLVQWMLHERYRRQIIFLPSFSRAHTGSSVANANGGRPAEPSTVDNPPSSSRGNPK